MTGICSLQAFPQDVYYPDYLTFLETRPPSPLPIEATDKRIIVHLDVNQTLTLQDGGQKISEQEIIQRSLAIACRDIWDASRCNELISYHDFVFDHLIPGPKSNQDLKQQRLNKVVHFIDHLEQETPPHHYAITARKIYNAAVGLLNQMKQEEKIVMPSFYKLIKYLDSCSIKYSIILNI